MSKKGPFKKEGKKVERKTNQNVWQLKKEKEGRTVKSQENKK
jgi:hypothetical protein